MRILFFDLYTQMGGVPSVAGRLIKSLAVQGAECIVVDPFGDVRELLNLGHDERITLVPLPLPAFMRRLELGTFQGKARFALLGPVVSLLCVIRLWVMIARMRPQFAYAHLPKSALLLSIAARLVRVPMVFHFHGAVEDADIGRLYRRILGTAAHIICVSEGSRQQLLRCGIVNEATVLYNGLEPEWLDDDTAPVRTRAEFGIPEEAFAFGFVGNIIPRKGIDTLISGFAILLARLPEDDRRRACLVIVGDDPIPGTRPYRTMLEQLAASLGIADQVRFHGTSRQVRTFMRSIDVFVLASRMESFGVVLAEAMSQGVPVISTRTGSIPEVVRDGETGLLVPSEQPEMLADAMQRLYSDRGLRQAFGSAGRGWVREQFSQERIAEALLQMLGKYTNRRP